MTATVTTSLSSIRTDPIRSFKFLVNIYNPPGRASLAGKNGLGFMTVSGLNFQTDIIPYRQGGMNTTPQKMPGQTDFSPLSLSRGALVGTSQAWDWNRQLFTVLQGTGGGSAKDDFRGTTDLQVLDHPATYSTSVHIKLWIRLYRTWPSAIGYSDLDAGGNGFMVESMSMAHEGFIMAWAPNTPGSDVNQSAIKAA